MNLLHGAEVQDPADVLRLGKHSVFISLLIRLLQVVPLSTQTIKLSQSHLMMKKYINTRLIKVKVCPKHHADLHVQRPTFCPEVPTLLQTGGA